MKKIILMVLIFGIVFCSAVFASKVGKVAGNYFFTDIKAYINDKEINSWNIGGKTLVCIEDLKDYGFNVEWNEELRQIRGNIDPNPIVLRETSKPLYANAYTEWINSTTPCMTRMVDSHGMQADFIESTLNEITIKFAKKISNNCINNRYFPIYQNYRNVSDKFNYTYSEEDNTLKIKLINYNIDTSIETTSTTPNGKIERLKGANFEVYLLEGITAKNGDVLPDTLKLKCCINWQVEE